MGVRDREKLRQQESAVMYNNKRILVDDDEVQKKSAELQKQKASQSAAAVQKSVPSLNIQRRTPENTVKPLAERMDYTYYKMTGNVLPQTKTAAELQDEVNSFVRNSNSNAMVAQKYYSNPSAYNDKTMYGIQQFYNSKAYSDFQYRQLRANLIKSSKENGTTWTQRALKAIEESQKLQNGIDEYIRLGERAYYAEQYNKNQKKGLTQEEIDAGAKELAENPVTPMERGMHFAHKSLKDSLSFMGNLVGKDDPNSVFKRFSERFNNIQPDASRRIELENAVHADVLRYRLDQFENVKNNSDFAEKSKSVDESKYNIQRTFDDDGLIVDKFGKNVERTLQDDYISEEEQQIYNYIYNTKGYKEAEEYYDLLALKLNERMTTDYLGQVEEMTLDAPVPLNVASFATNAMSGLGYVNDTVNTLSGKPLDTNNLYHLPANVTNEIRTTTQDNYIDSDVGKFLYSTGMSMGDFAFSFALSKVMGVPQVATALMSTSAATNTVIDAKNRGLSDAQAYTLGTTAGAIEYVTEKMSVEALYNSLFNGKAASQTIAKNFFTEGTEEVVSSSVNFVADIIVSKDKSEWEVLIAECMKQGMSREKAIEQAIKYEAKQLALEFIAGGISGGLMGGGVSVYNNTVNNQYNKIVGNQLTENNQNQNVFELAKGLDYNSEANKYAYSANPKKSKQLGKLYDKAYFQADTEVNNNSNQIIAQRLADLGEKASTIPEISEGIRKTVYNEPLSEHERNMLGASKNARQVLKEFEDALSGRESAIRHESIDRLNKLSAALTTKSIDNTVTVGSKKEKTKVTGVKSISENGVVTYNLENGKTATSKEVSFDNEFTAQLNESASKYGAVGADAFIKMYGGEDAVEYSQAFDALFRQGKNDPDGKLKADVMDTPAAQFLNPSQSEAAYEAGRVYAQKLSADTQQEINTKPRYVTDIENIAQKGSQKTIGNVNITGIRTKNLTKKQKASINVMNEVSKVTNGTLKMVAFESTADLDGQIRERNGWYDSSTNTIYFDINAGIDNVYRQGELDRAILRTGGHELTHFIQHMSPEYYAGLKGFIVDSLNSADPNRTEQLISAKLKALPKLSYDEVYDEVIADSCEMLLRDSKAIQKLARENMTLAQKIKAWIDDFVKNIKKAFEGVSAKSLEARQLEIILGDMTELQNMWDEALEDALRTSKEKGTANGTQENSNIKHSIRYTTDNKPVVVIEENILDRVPENEWVKTVKTVMSEKFSAGIPIKGRLVKVNRITKREYVNSNDTQKYEKKNPEIYKDKLNTASQLNEIVLASTNYINEAPNHSRKKDNFKDFARGEVLMRIGTNSYEANVIVALDGKNEMVLYDIVSFKPTNFTIKKEAKSLTVAPNKDINDSLDLTSNNSIPPTSENVNKIKKSDKVESVKFSQRDSAGNKLSENQIEYFKDSKVRDKDGNLLVMYHGTPHDFTVFKNRGSGMYFTADPEYAYGYTQLSGKVMKVYLNITKPFDILKDDVAKKIFVDEFIKGGYAQGIHPSSSMSEINKYIENGVDWVEGDNLIEFLEENEYDYDGLVINEGSDSIADGTGNKAIWRGFSYVTFNSNQSKNVENLNPTADPDVRYSKRIADDVDLEKSAVEYFGKTYSWKETGYILLNGSKLDFSGKHNGARGGYRTVDHREIIDSFPEEVQDELDGNEAMVEFMQRGNIRIMPEGSGINLSLLPTDAQEKALADFISRERGEVTLDIDDEYGYTVVSVDYPKGTRSDRILRDIRQYFKDGTEPVVSDVSRFRYSQRVTSDDFLSTENRARPKSASSINWVYKAKIFSVTENTMFHQKINEINQGSKAFEQNADGEYMLPIENKIVFTDGYYGGPYIREIIEVMTDSATRFEFVKEVVFNVEKGRQGLREAARIVENTLGKGSVIRYNSRFDGAYEWTNGKRKGKNRRAVIERYQRLQNGRRNDTEGRGTESVKFSERVFDDQGFTHRELLRNALSTVARNDTERDFLARYQREIKDVEKKYEEVAKLRRQIHDISFTKGSDRSQLPAIKNRVAILEDQIQRTDKKLLQLEATKALKDVVEREKKTAVKKANERNKQTFERYKSRKRSSEVREKIKSLHKDLVKSLLYPTDKNYIPPYLVKSMVDVCNAIDFSTDRTGPDGGKTKAQEQREKIKSSLNKLKNEYEKLKKDNDPNYRSEYDEAMAEELTQLIDMVSNSRVGDMTETQLQAVYQSLKTIQGTLRDAKKQIGMEEGRTNAEIGLAIIEEQRQIDRKKKGVKKLGQKYSDLVAWNTVSPMRNILRISGYDKNSELYQLAEQLNEGQRKKDIFVMESHKMFEHLVEGKENKKKYQDAIGKAHDFGVVDVDGNAVEMSKMTAMQLVMSWEREMASDGKHSHLQQSGAIIPNHKLLMDGKVSEAVSAEHAQRIDVDATLINDIIDQLDEWDKEYMGVAHKLFDEKSKNALNETSRVVSHRDVALSEKYIPYKVDEDFVFKKEISDENHIRPTLISMGMLKDTVRNAGQPLVMTSLNHVLDTQIEQVGAYYGLAIPVRNFNKVWNFMSDNRISVRESITKNWGKKGMSVIDQTIRDLQAERVSERNKFIDKANSAFVRSVLNSNISVTLKQLSALPSAYSVLNQRFMPGYVYGQFLKMCVPSKYNQTIKEIDEYTAAHWLRRQGLSSQELGDIAKSMGKMKRFNDWLPAAINPTKWIQGMDCLVTASFWDMCKKDIRKQGEFEEGTEEFNRAVADLYNRVIEDTQAVYDTLHRPEVLKTTNALTRQLFMFRSESLQHSGILYEKYGAFLENKDAESRKEFFKTAYAQFSSAFSFAALSLVAAGLLHKMNPYRDEDEELTPESIIAELLNDLTNVLADLVMPIGGAQLQEFIYGKISGNKYSDGSLSVPAVDFINDFIDSVSTLNNAITAEEPDDGKIIKAVEDLTFKFAGLFGFPADNLKNIIKTFILNAEDIKNGEFGSFEAGVDRSNTVNYHRATEALIEGDMQKYDDVITELTENEVGQDKIQQGIKNQLKEFYLDGQINDQQAIKLLAKYGGDDDENDAYFTVKSWNEPGGSFSVYGDLREAITLGGDIDSTINDLVSHGKDESDVKVEIKKTIKKLYISDQISDQYAIDLLKMYHEMDDYEIYWQFREWDYYKNNPTAESGSYRKYGSLYEVVNEGGDADIAGTVKMYMDNGVSKKSIGDELTSKYKKKYIELYYSDKTAAANLKNSLLRAYYAAGYNWDNKSKDIDAWLKDS